jgi:Putative peptidoglycan binding domain
MRAGSPRTMDHVQETRAPVSGARSRPRQQPVDDWLGEISDEDWSENAAELAERRRATPAYQELPMPPEEPWPESTVAASPPARSMRAPDPRRAAVERRRLVAGFVGVVIVAIVIAVPLLLLRGGNDTPTAATQDTATTATTPATSATTPATTTTSPTTTSPTTTSPTTTSPTTTSPTTTTTPSTSTSGFTLPDGTKLRLGEGDPEQIKALQQALTSAGYDPGPVDGTFGQRTEAAVTAFQQANGLSADGVVGPETAAALNSALSG